MEDSIFADERCRALSLLLAPPSLCTQALVPYQADACALLAEASALLLNDPKLRELPDVASFAYFCRRANIEKKRQAFQNQA
ncbi:MAG: hypothetical protein FWE65_03570, partial [Eggerthellaceae bacterium]|nr:hypothetical protein [Eggerthellaceae bacterium]